MRRLKYIIFIAIISCSCLYLPDETYSKDIPFLKNVEVKVDVKYDATLRIFKYNYEIKNNVASTGSIRNFQVDITRSASSRELSTDNLIVQLGTNPSGSIIGRTFNEEMNRLSQVMEIGIIPVGMKPPDNWTALISIAGTVSWGSKYKTSLILPNQSLSGFEISSPGLPGFRDFSAKPDWVLVVDGSVSEDDIAKSKKINEDITFTGISVGPVAPPKELNPLEYINIIVTMNHKASARGWITKQGIVKSLDAKLENAKNKLAQGKTIAAINMLEEFINEVEAQGCETYDNCPKGKHIMPEAYALMKYNVQYLISTLQ